MIPVMALFWYWGKQDRPPGFFLGWFAVLYAPLRFGLDFLRNTDLAGFDIRHFGLTAAQWAMVAPTLPAPTTVILFRRGMCLLPGLLPRLAVRVQPQTGPKVRRGAAWTGTRHRARDRRARPGRSW